MKREFTEEAGNITDPAERAEFNRLTDQLFSTGEVSGYSRDIAELNRLTDQLFSAGEVAHRGCAHYLPVACALLAGCMRTAYWLHATGEVVYRGYVDDPRNTDHSWMETTAFHFHCSPALGARLPLHAGDGALMSHYSAIN